MKAWISGYALTKGIYKVKGEYLMTHRAFYDKEGNTYTNESRGWHPTKKEAIARAEEMRDEEKHRIMCRWDELSAMVFK